MKVSGTKVHVCCITFLHYRPSLPQQQMDQCGSQLISAGQLSWNKAAWT